MLSTLWNIDWSHISDKALELLKYNEQEPMLFNSGLFLYLFIGFSLGYALLSRASSLRIIYVILFSLFFYYKSSGIYFMLLIFVSICDYIFAQQMARTKGKGKRKLWVVASVLVNLGLLGYFKYTKFFFADIFGADFMDFDSIFLPVGISFFVFQSMSYTIDTYRGSITPLSNYFDYLFYLSFFPQIVAGPIVRAKDFIPQIRKPLAITRRMFGTGIALIIIGLIKKAVISDYISLNFVDSIFNDPTTHTGFECLLGVYGYALQIYCDFSGYSDMAIGIALLLGFHFPKNFDAPYKSATITEFWRRWHISLSSWLRDYLYISLGGNRKGKTRQYFNLIITMVLGGLWHGAALRFILWGALHGLALAIHKIWLAIIPGAKMLGKDMKPFWRLLGIILTFHVVCLGWILFRANDMEQFYAILHQIYYNFNPEIAPQIWDNFKIVCIMIIIGYVMHFLSTKRCERMKEWVAERGFFMQALLLVATIWLVMQFKTGVQPFIYFQF